ncbi:helix-turn-helix domain-containing protein [Microbacterium xanthum]|uniref:helix-turn-helix domain-containing protein n=1 Tax=Microbacterium xanthum TaxID=3079794 RepID=UPI002AD4EB67|nr:hypothetical protein [Microbacterium sp. KSW-48]MDZ8170673.1 hypothetical protein [Microbacterium sp. KSW-48]
MQELVGRLTALDAEASESLKVISYFDALVARGVGPDALLRAAAALSGAVVGSSAPGRTRRMQPTGRPAEEVSGAARLSRRVHPSGQVWIERREPHANDAMILERLALALEITAARRGNDPVDAVEQSIDEHLTPAERRTASARLRLTPGDEVCVVATLPDAPPPVPGPSALVVTEWGPARAFVTRTVPSPPTDADATASAPARVGVGIRVTPPDLPESWRTATLALRMTSPELPFMDADEMGAIMLLAEAADERAAEHPDVVTLAGLDPRHRVILDAYGQKGSVRQAAALAGVHHSTAQDRFAHLADLLGYDVRHPNGLARYTIARILLTLSRPGF